MSEGYLTYEQSGVSIDANDEMVARITRSLARTQTPRVMPLHNGFAGLFRLDYNEKLFRKNYREPVLVACTDGVGTKIKLAEMAGRYDTIGIDLVAMSVNDMIVQGAEPLFFLDYLAVHRLVPEQIAEMVEGVAAGCRQADCALLGGETAEMPDVYREGEFDMAGFAVGVVERRRLINGSRIGPGDVVLGLASSGLHSNGYALARHICFKKGSWRPEDRPDELEGRTVLETLLQPTRIYVRSIVGLLAGYRVKRVVHGMAHITGGGLVGNVPRVVPKGCNVVIRKGSWSVPPVFGLLQKAGPVEEREMFRVFNMGIGYVLIVARDFADSIEDKLRRAGEQVWRIGKVTGGTGKVILK
ncbi:MAG TPA: phosphoribosylformylglycinamidine cyclo-ligase [Phycisphaerales bacterium]|nr:phosphoribosylformylglycinamidine cyclo-ligase [Phycisphaerales bacterium]